MHIRDLNSIHHQDKNAAEVKTGRSVSSFCCQIRFKEELDLKAKAKVAEHVFPETRPILKQLCARYELTT
jgi:hypothetical protein